MHLFSVEDCVLGNDPGAIRTASFFLVNTAVTGQRSLDSGNDI